MTEELPHIRCLECGKPIAHLWNRYQDLLASGVKPELALTQLGLSRYCCRMWMMSPFKVPIHSERQVDPRDPDLEQQATTLTVMPPRQTVLAPLQTMANPVPVSVNVPAFPPLPALPGNIPTPVPRKEGYEVVPLGGIDVGLPAIPEIPVPQLPGGPEETTNVTRKYYAW